MTRSDLREYGPKNGTTGRMGPAPSSLPTINAAAFRNSLGRLLLAKMRLHRIHWPVQEVSISATNCLIGIISKLAS